ncbi:DNA-binding transcriptional regulator LsrR (DeoR family) [Palleronia aestuarii]|uniref:DNA-binding transcriptional regulator LsrR (DeoR family) n=1 Tax=Palleronia aestuarii TaxID=568105 RepID=A0A2W7MW60_9RHOB|nr:sugar-binding domain-containing protein [Palleronia aestuarii]PZX11881.1 DNA-binding transcriptional regulator LsrR (DeoR family) [Palleronia aestuarii]
MPQSKDASYDRRARFAAYLHAMHDMPQAEIGHVLGGLSQSHVSRLLTHAERAGYLVVERRLSDDALDEDDRRALRDLLAPAGLIERLTTFCEAVGQATPNVVVHQSGPGTTEGAMALRRRRFGRAAAGGLATLLRDQALVGVAWGRTLGAVVDGIAHSKAPRPVRGDIEIVPVCAELLTVPQRDLSSSRIAERLFDVLVSDRRPVPQLTGFPAYVPRHYDGPAREAIWRLIRDAPNYDRILHGPDSLAGRMDALLTAVGHTELLVLGGLDDLLRAAGMRAEELHRLVIGDIGGILVPRPDATQGDREVIAELNAMWTGISLDQVTTIARRARLGSPAAGVVVFALRSDRAPTLVEVVRQGLASHLVIDHEAAAGLNACLKELL